MAKTYNKMPPKDRTQQTPQQQDGGQSLWLDNLEIIASGIFIII